MMRGKPGYEHLNEPLHILVEGELPVEIVDARLMQAREILEDLLKPVVISLLLFSYLACKAFFIFSSTLQINFFLFLSWPACKHHFFFCQG